MIQRIQSVWLLLAAVFDAITFRFPFYNGDWTKDTIPSPVDLNAQSTIWLTVISVLTGVLAFAAIFLFGNRKLQLKMAMLGLVLSAVLLVLYFLEMANFTNGSIALWCLFYFAVFLFFLMAARGIMSDQKLVKSLDRLR